MLTTNRLTANTLVLAFVSACFVCVGGYASGIYSGGGDTPVNKRGWQEFWDRARDTKVKRLDRAYVAGEKIYLGKGRHEKFNYCLADFTKLNSKLVDIADQHDVNVDPSAFRSREKIELSSKAVAPYRELRVSDFVQALYDCDDADSLVLTKLE